jgi:hypothetical protein
MKDLPARGQAHPVERTEATVSAGSGQPGADT